MPEYHVSWEIDVVADNAHDAAVEAQRIQRDPQSTATVFDVTEQFSAHLTKTKTERIDLAEDEE